MKIIVLLHPQGFTDTPRGKTQIQSSLCHSQAVSQLEFGSIDTTVEDEKHRPSPIATGGLRIVLSATFKIDDSKRFLLLRLKELIQKNYELLDQSPQSTTATDEEEPRASDNEEDLSIVLVIMKQKRTSTTGTGNAIIIKLGLDRRLK